MGCLRSPYDPSLIYRYIQCIYGFIGREITIHKVIYGVYIRFWPTVGVVYSKNLISGNLSLCVTHPNTSTPMSAGPILISWEPEDLKMRIR